ncbi:MAG: guanylate kinase [Deltaproteobacteria bacterium]|nr:guanylate kinase [Deltaproteobacteria bacterium]
MSAGSAQPGIPFVVAAPSGTGKTTVCRRVVELDGRISFSVSHTTRRKRDAEVEGRDYCFVDEPEFRRLVAKGEFLEWAEYNAHLYGTSWQAIDRGLAGGRDLLLEIEVQGARQVRARRSDARLIFLLPPSVEELERRLTGRGTDSAEEVRRRLDVANREFEAIGDFDYAVTNDDLECCVAKLGEIIRAEREGSVRELRERFSPAVAEEEFRGSRTSNS